MARTTEIKRPHRSRTRHTGTAFIGAALSAALMLAACGDGVTSTTTSGSGAPPTAPASARVDQAKPAFSNPTRITNPLFPIGALTQVVQLGTDEGQELRAEITLLPDRRTIEWDGRQIEAVVSQFIAYKDATVAEVATDYFAQADDGAVWYLGEDVTNYEDGVVANHDGTWLAGKDGPAGMIMPASPKPGDVYRPENIPGFVFEEVTVKSTRTVDGPRGQVPGAIAIQELLMDGTLEDKVFAPGYGEFEARVTDKELLTLALAVPVDAKGGGVPVELAALATGAADIFRLAPSRDFDALSATVAGMTAAWDSHARTGPPALLATHMGDSLGALSAAVKAQKPDDVRQASVAVARAGLDLQLQFTSPADTDLARIEVWARKLIADAAANDTGGVRGNMVIVDATWDRVDHAVEAPGRADVETARAELRSAVEAGDMAATSSAAEKLRQVVAGARLSS